MERIQSWLRAVHFSLRGGATLNGFDEEHSARGLHLVLAAFLIWTVFNDCVVVPLFVIRKTEVGVAYFFAGLTTLAALLLLRRGRRQVAATLFLAFLWCVFAVYSLMRGGIHSNVNIAMVPLVVLAAWQLGRTPAIGFLVASLLFGFIEAMLEYSGHSLAVYFSGAPLALWFGGAGVMMLAVAPILFALEELKTARFPHD